MKDKNKKTNFKDFFKKAFLFILECLLITVVLFTLSQCVQCSNNNQSSFVPKAYAAEPSQLSRTFDFGAFPFTIAKSSDPTSFTSFDTLNYNRQGMRFCDVILNIQLMQVGPSEYKYHPFINIFDVQQSLYSWVYNDGSFYMFTATDMASSYLYPVCTEAYFSDTNFMLLTQNLDTLGYNEIYGKASEQFLTYDQVSKINNYYIEKYSYFDITDFLFDPNPPSGKQQLYLGYDCLKFNFYDSEENTDIVYSFTLATKRYIPASEIARYTNTSQVPNMYYFYYNDSVNPLDSYNYGYSVGNKIGFDDGKRFGYDNAINSLVPGDYNYDRIFNAGKIAGIAEENPVTFRSMFTALLDVPLQLITALLNFDILGINLFAVFGTIITVLIGVFLIKLIF